MCRSGLPAPAWGWEGCRSSLKVTGWDCRCKTAPGDLEPQGHAALPVEQYTFPFYALVMARRRLCQMCRPYLLLSLLLDDCSEQPAFAYNMCFWSLLFNLQVWKKKTHCFLFHCIVRFGTEVTILLNLSFCWAVRLQNESIQQNHKKIKSLCELKNMVSISFFSYFALLLNSKKAFWWFFRILLASLHLCFSGNAIAGRQFAMSQLGVITYQSF